MAESAAAGVVVAVGNLTRMVKCRSTRVGKVDGRRTQA